MVIEDFIKRLALPISGKMEGKDRYVVTLNDSNDFAKIYSFLEESPDVILEGENILLSENSSMIRYISADGEEYSVSLVSDFANDAYRCIIEPSIK